MKGLTICEMCEWFFSWTNFSNKFNRSISKEVPSYLKVDVNNLNSGCIPKNLEFFKIQLDLRVLDQINHRVKLS